MRAGNQKHQHVRDNISFVGLHRLAFYTAVAALLCALMSAGSLAQANDVYITPDGGGNGVCTSNTHTPAWFNAPGNWGTGASQIGPGTTVHLCGTFTGAQGATLLRAQGSGSSGNPVTILFESGTILTSPAWSGSGAIVISGVSYLVVDGGTNGIIQNTAAGTNLSIHPNGFTSIAIYASNSGNGACTPGCRVTNLTVSNLYVHARTDCSVDYCADQSPNQQKINAVSMIHADGIRMDHMTVHDVGWAFAGSASNVEIDHNNVYNIDHGLAFGADGYNTTGLSVHDNHIHDMDAWSTGNCNAGCNGYHHDAVHIWNAGPPVSNSNVMIYNNLFDGIHGLHNVTAYLYAEGVTTNVNIFNNVFVSRLGSPIPFIWMGVNNPGTSSGTKILNNTFVNGDPSRAAILMYDTTGFIWQNNLFSGANTFFNAASTTGIVAGDYNQYEAQGAGGNYAFNFGSKQTNSLSTWQSLANLDLHSHYYGTSSLNTDGTPKSNSPAGAAGANLTSMGITALNADKNGNLRPSSGPWSVGAYNPGTAAATTVTPPTNLKATVQ